MSTLKANNIKDIAGGENVHMAGAVLQVVQAIDQTQEANSSNSYSTAISTSITPKFSDSKVLINVSGMCAPDTSNQLGFKLLRGSTEIGSGTGGTVNNYLFGVGTTQSDFEMTPFSHTHLDSPSTTASTTYTLQYAALNGTGKLGGRADNTDNSGATTITLIEVGQ